MKAEQRSDLERSNWVRTAAQNASDMKTLKHLCCRVASVLVRFALR